MYRSCSLRPPRMRTARPACPAVDVPATAFMYPLPFTAYWLLSVVSLISSPPGKRGGVLTRIPRVVPSGCDLCGDGQGAYRSSGTYIRREDARAYEEGEPPSLYDGRRVPGVCGARIAVVECEAPQMAVGEMARL